MRGDITSPTAVVDRRPSRYRAVTRAAAATVAAVALSTGGAFALPASAEPATVETNLAEHTNPAVQVITTEYHATASLGRIQFSKAGQQLVVRAYVKLLHREFGAAGFVSYIFDRAQRLHRQPGRVRPHRAACRHSRRAGEDDVRAGGCRELRSG
jgi:hypothetical protein